MNTSLNILLNKTYYEIFLADNKDYDFFSKLSNWLSGEFDLFLQEEYKNELIIYYPNGLISLKYDYLLGTLKILIKNKLRRNCEKLYNKIIIIYNSNYDR